MSDSSVPKLRVAGLRRLLASLSLFVAVFLIVVHFFQFDELAPVTLIPPWMWLVPAAMFLVVSCRAITRSMLLVTLGVWALFVISFAEEISSFPRFRSLIADASDRENVIRIATLNCNFGSSVAALEPQEFAPDIILFQESMGPESLEIIATEYFGVLGSSLHDGDVSIITCGKLKPVHVNPASHFVHAVVTLDNGQSIDVVSLRLSPPVFRIDILKPGFWTDHRDRRKQHRRQLEEVVNHIETFAETEIIVIGGDFNLVGNDGALSAMGKFRDSFFESGSGWGNTGTSDYPLFRVDQIWTSQNFECLTSKAFATKHSDHRMVIADFGKRKKTH